MAFAVTNGAQLTCPFGVAPSNLIITPENRVMIGTQPAATINDFVPMKNIMPFGMCNTLTNPQVAAATAAALGVLTPMPCIPVTTAPWTPGSSKVMIGKMPALTSTSTCMCVWGGSISVVNPGQTSVQIP